MLRKPQTLLLTIGGLIVIGLVAFVLYQAYYAKQVASNSATIGGAPGAAPNMPSNTGGTPNHEKNSGGPVAPGPGASPIQAVLQNATYAAIIKEQVAQGLHLTSQQVTAQVQQGKTLSDIASAQGISDTQLNSIEVQAFQTAYNQGVKDGKISQSAADQAMQILSNKGSSQIVNNSIRTLFNGSASD